MKKNNKGKCGAEDSSKEYIFYTLRAAEGVISHITNSILGPATLTRCERKCAVFWIEELADEAVEEEELPEPESESSGSTHLEIVTYDKAMGFKQVPCPESGMLTSMLYETLDFSRKHGVIWGALVIDMEPGFTTSVYYYPKRVSRFLPDWPGRLDRALTDPKRYSKLVRLNNLVAG